MRRAWIRAGVALVVLAGGASCSNDDSADATATVPPSTTIAAETTQATIAAETTEATSTTEAPATTVDPPTVAAPVEFTACMQPGPQVEGTIEDEDPVGVLLPDGEMVLRRRRGVTWRLGVSDVSDPRFEGTWYLSSNFDAYASPDGAPGPSVWVETFLVENNEGTWQGSQVSFNWPDGEGPDGKEVGLIMYGTGAYEGLTAMMRVRGGCPKNTWGYIMEIPEAPVPSTGH